MMVLETAQLLAEQFGSAPVSSLSVKCRRTGEECAINSEEDLMRAFAHLPLPKPRKLHP